jgi:hypothetical protein
MGWAHLSDLEGQEMGKRLPRQQTITKMAPETGLFMARRCRLQANRVFLSLSDFSGGKMLNCLSYVPG